MSRERTPALAGTIPSIEVFLKTMKLLAERATRISPIIKVGISIAEKYYERIENNPTYVISTSQYSALDSALPTFLLTRFVSVLHPSLRLDTMGTNWTRSESAKAAKIFIETVSFELIDTIINIHSKFLRFRWRSTEQSVHTSRW